MNNGAWGRILRIRPIRVYRPIRLLTALAVLGIAVGGLTLALAADESALPAHFSGLFNDYTPNTVAGGPYEMHGRWSLDLDVGQGTATFSADMTMEMAAFANPDSDPTALKPHTHHIVISDGTIHNSPSDTITWQNTCVPSPPFSPAVTGGFVVTGTAYVTGNGNNPPFGNPSPATICILGGMQNSSITGAQAFVKFSNFTLIFGPPADTHFGPQPINGVVSSCEGPEAPWNHEPSDCTVSVVQ